ncbi:hypothetical protein CVT26_001685 [Gymnopilus dilepis]|uniref:NAD(P)-binding protein n=1 Tax=Gymnopilus dilepis TaxID=231916 RepID=A0A409VRI3_9AGAR|nr:hypothetical protein CVT26_001685 [Gymnopilus dilepis]
MPGTPFVLIAPGATRGLGLALTRHYLRTTSLPVFATHRRASNQDGKIKELVLSPLQDVDPRRLGLLHLDLCSESSIESAADRLYESLGTHGADLPYIHTAFLTGGTLTPERKPSELDWGSMKATFQINVISHMLLIKHFSRFLPDRTRKDVDSFSKWVHVSARVGSISDNKLGGWYSYRSSKAALNQVVKTFDLHLEQQNMPAMSIGVHPGTVQTDLSKAFWNSTPSEKLFEPDFAACKLADVVQNISIEQRGRVWDWSGREVPR